jgi:hypothetical protein
MLDETFAKRLGMDKSDGLSIVVKGRSKDFGGARRCILDY